MDDTHETIADIAAEKRRIAKEIRDYASNGDYWDKKRANETAEDLEEEADRLEAAIKREKAAIEADALAVGGIVEAAHMRELSKNTSKNKANFGQLGDAAKLREALEAIISGYENADLCDMNYCEWCHEPENPCVSVSLCKAIHESRAALAAPPRNCDLARDWMRDLYAHFQPPASIKREMPPEWVDAVMAFCRWLVAPATEKEGGAK